MLLELEGFVVLTAANGDDALEVVRNINRLDIIVTDYRLPTKFGNDIVRDLREILKHTVPAIILTGDITIGENINAGLDKCRVLKKPIDTENFINYIFEMTT